MAEEQIPDPASESHSAEPGRNQAPRKHAKKRTKTGCLTCRKRRIKCGEEKPICSNCVKSKRICEGYAQRVVFKNPLGILGPYGPPQSHAPQLVQQPPRPLYNDYSTLPPQQAAAAAQHPMLAPRLPEATPSGYTYEASSTAPTGAKYQETRQSIDSSQFHYPTFLAQAPQQCSSDSVESDERRTSQSTASAYTEFHPQPNTSHNYDSHPSYDELSPQMPRPITDWASIAAQDHSSDLYPPLYNTSTTEYRYPQSDQAAQPTSPVQFIPLSQPQVLYIEDEAEDFYDVESDEEMVDQTQTEGFNQLNLIMASASNDDRQLRSFTTHLNEPNILASYYPTLGSSPLNNPKTARIFAHFIHSTGPSLSIFERHPTDSSIMLGMSVPPAQRGLWTYTLPLKALEHPALLQAILAISSLHIAYLQQAHTTVSLKHYHYALKRIGRAVGLPGRRKHIGTMAATQLLAYYEVISADHSKWNSHLAGSAQIIREIDWAGITRDLRAHRRRLNENQAQMGWSDSSMYYPQSYGSEISDDDPFAGKEGTVDEALIGSLMGRAISYDEFGHVEGPNPQTPKKHFSRKDIDTFRIQCDLYWWFTKQDVFHSMVSGDKLFMPQHLRAQCPPRAGMGRIDAIYGSTDHFWLLLGRITDFGYRDRKRKLKVLRVAGTEWKPNAGLFRFMGRFTGGSGPPGPPPSGPPSSTPASGTRPGPPPDPPPEGPPMYGMVPPQAPAQLPKAFSYDRRGQRSSPEVDDGSEDTTYADAEREWEEILVAMDTFMQALGREFQPLPSDVTPLIESPFGPARQYRTHTIAVLWGFYYAGRILLHRLHPCMPPAMMMAAGVAAPTTAKYAQIVGRIMAGIYYPQIYNLQAGSLSPTLGSSLTEMTMPMFFAGVQYVDPVQRVWTIAKLRDVSRLTGWKTSDAIAGGCEKAWIVAAKYGRGPPYERSFRTDRDRDGQDVLERDLSSSYSEDRRFVTVQAPDRAHLAMGLLSLEGDMKSLEL
ncbi:hypothetical protein N7478_008378 [Penicillium angulare]|uniref:uncharacterized protein n=1 Tax=Penicillium angulare TaxID=116970 RepID=UPI0025407778|nr:uncharacterized protein N7478_008378 [Penicillium angulare]KAJ5273253.1 hypothetical protein N7478_008378 [Penicillium angulare]